ncbi:hypothetical protein J4405_06350 [Candidatus Woesearchaeota archaeon]|nr:hypothetical protein [Candidatus Woesearchaeota archaeon]
MNEYWNSLLTEKSWKILHELKNYDFILIGGWAVYLHAHKQKSKDIDIVVGIKELEKLKEYGLNKNDNLKKYEIKKEEIDIDIYAEYYSKLTIPAENIKDYAVKIEGFKVASKELLLILKQGAFKNREFSVKGEKDRIDIISLLFSEIDFDNYCKILKKYKLESFFDELKKVLVNFKDYNALNLNPREFKIKKNKILEELKKAI